MTILVTGGAGFIGANFVLDWLDLNEKIVIQLEKTLNVGSLQYPTTVTSDKSDVVEW